MFCCCFFFRNLERRKQKKHTVPVAGYNSSDTLVVDRAVEITDSLSHKAFIIATYRGMFRLYVIENKGKQYNYIHLNRVYVKSKRA